MQTIDRWRKWRPADEKSDESVGIEPPKPPKVGFEGFEGSISGQTQSSFDRPPDDPAAWREDFAQWLASACARHPRVFGGVRALHLAFCEWENARGMVPSNLVTFERLLVEQGFLTGEIGGVMLVSELSFRGDVEALLHAQRIDDGGKPLVSPLKDTGITGRRR
jgi:hypothetical protein